MAVTNNDGKPFLGGTTGGWSALDAATGQILWQTADPTNGIDPGAVSVANCVVYAGSLQSDSSKPTFYALDAATGQIKWSFASGGSINSGAAISNGVVFWGSGYSNFGLGSPNNKFYAFGLR